MKLGMPSLIELDTLEENVALCKKLGLSFVELNMNLPIFVPEVLDAEALRVLRKREGVGFTLHLPEEMDVASFQPAMREGHLRRCKEIIRWAGHAGIAILNMHLNNGIHFTLPDRKVRIYEKYQGEFLRRLKSAYRQIWSWAAEAGVQVCIENTNNFYLPFIQKGLEELSKIEGFALTWDAGHDAKADFRESPVLLKFEKAIRHMHLHDFNGKSDHQALYTGLVPINERLRFAKDHDLSVVIEVKTANALAESVDALVKKP